MIAPEQISIFQHTAFCIFLGEEDNPDGFLFKTTWGSLCPEGGPSRQWPCWAPSSALTFASVAVVRIPQDERTIEKMTGTVPSAQTLLQRLTPPATAPSQEDLGSGSSLPSLLHPNSSGGFKSAARPRVFSTHSCRHSGVSHASHLSLKVASESPYPLRVDSWVFPKSFLNLASLLTVLSPDNERLLPASEHALSFLSLRGKSTVPPCRGARVGASWVSPHKHGLDCPRETEQEPTSALPREVHFRCVSICASVARMGGRGDVHSESGMH